MKTVEFKTAPHRHSLLKASVANLLCAGLLTACGSSFKSVEGLNSDTNYLSEGGSSSGTTEFQKLNLSGKLDGGRFSQKTVLGLDKVSKELLLTLPLPANPNIDGMTAEIPIQQIPGARLRLEPMPEGGSAIVLRIPISYLVRREVDFPEARRLPNGDPLPMIAAGALPAFAVTIPNVKNTNLTVYLDVGAVGVFINTPFDPMINWSFPIKNLDGTRVLGALSLVAAKARTDGGFFISAQIPDDIARIIDDNI